MEASSDALRGFPVFVGGFQPQPDVNAPDDEHAFVFLDFPNCVAGQQAVAGRDLTRLQRAPEGANQSAGRGRNDVVERGGSLLEVRCVALEVVLGDRAMNAELNGFCFAWKIRAAQRPFHTFDTNLGSVHDIGHNPAIVRCTGTETNKPVSVSF